MALSENDKLESPRLRRLATRLPYLLILAVLSVLLAAEPMGYTLAWAYWPGDWAVKVAQGFVLVICLVGAGCCLAVACALVAIASAWRGSSRASGRLIYLWAVVLLCATGTGFGISWIALMLKWRI